MSRCQQFILIGVMVLFISGCGGGQQVDEPESSAPLATVVPTATALPPLPTVPAPGSAGDPYEVVLPVELSEDQTAELAAVFTAETDLSVAVVAVDGYEAARQALCDGHAAVVALDAFTYLAAQQLDCGEALYVAEVNGATSEQAQFIARDVFAPRFYRGEYCRSSPDSLSGWVIPRLYLLSRGVDPLLTFQEIIDTGSDEAVVENVLSRECGLGATQVDAQQGLEDLPDFQFLQVLIPELPAVPYDVVVISGELGEVDRAAFVDALRVTNEELADIFDVDDWVPVGDAAFTPLLELLDAADVDIEALMH